MKLENGQGIPATLVAGDVVNGLKLIRTKLCRIISKSSPTQGVVSLTGIVRAAKQNNQAWAQFQNLYWDTSESRLTTTASGNTLAGVAVEDTEATATEGKILLNGLPAIWGD